MQLLLNIRNVRYVSATLATTAFREGVRRGLLSLVALIYLVSFLVASPAVADPWAKVEKHVSDEISQAHQDAKITESLIEKEKNALRRQVEAGKKSLAQTDDRVKALKSQFEALRQQEQKIQKELASKEEDMRLLEGIVKSCAKDAATIMNTSLINPEYPHRASVVESILEKDRFPGLEDIKGLTNFWFQEMEASGTILRRTGTFINVNGEKTKGTIVRIGTFMAFATDGNTVDCLKYDSNSGFLVTIAPKLPWSLRRAIKKYFNGDTNHLPLDLSGGVIFKEFSAGSGIFDWLRSGGFLVWPIILIGTIALFLSIERIVYLYRVNGNTTNIMTDIEKFLQAGKLEDCRKLCMANSNAPACSVLKAGLENIRASKEAFESSLQEAILQELPKLERFLPTLSVLAAIAPLLGLLGTVTGMIDTFQVITRYGTNDPRMMSGGISEALITTQLGLAVAIPILIVHHFLERRVDSVVADMEEKGTALTLSALNYMENSMSR